MTYYLVHWLVASVAVMMTAYFVPGFHVNSIFAALFAAVAIGLVNIVVWPILAVLTLPLTILTFGLFLLVVNALSLKIAAMMTPGFSIDGFWPAVLGSIVLSVLGWILKFVIFSNEAGTPTTLS